MSSAAWSLLPTLFQQAQFAYRLQTYVALAIAGLVLVGALALTRRAESGRATRVDRRSRSGWGSPSRSAWRSARGSCGFRTPTYTRENSRPMKPSRRPARPADVPAPIVERGKRLRRSQSSGRRHDGKFTFDPAAVEDDRLAGSSSFPPGLQPFATNIAGGPYLVHVGGGVRVVGRTAKKEWTTVKAATSCSNARRTDRSPSLSN